MDEYLHGRIAGVRLCDIVHLLMEQLSQVDSIAVRSIDSARAAEDLRKILTFHRIPFRQSNGNILLSRGSFLEALGKRTFTGFDELWFFQKGEPHKDLSRVPRATSDSEDFSAFVPPEIVEAVRETYCVLLVADGDSLNFLVNNPQIAESLTKIALSNERQRPK